MKKIVLMLFICHSVIFASETNDSVIEKKTRTFIFQHQAKRVVMELVTSPYITFENTKSTWQAENLDTKLGFSIDEAIFDYAGHSFSILPEDCKDVTNIVVYPLDMCYNRLSNIDIYSMKRVGELFLKKHETNPDDIKNYFQEIIQLFTNSNYHEQKLQNMWNSLSLEAKRYQLRALLDFLLDEHNTLFSEEEKFEIAFTYKSSRFNEVLGYDEINSLIKLLPSGRNVKNARMVQ